MVVMDYLVLTGGSKAEESMERVAIEKKQTKVKGEDKEFEGEAEGGATTDGNGGHLPV